MGKLPKELVHYTGWETLQGMAENKCLWASHIKFMNDDAEYHHAEKFIERELVPLLKAWLNKRFLEDPPFASKIIKRFGNVENAAEHEAGAIAKSLYQVTGDEFYVASFCGLPEDEYTANNGLLSQWRAYGNSAGVAIYFDTEKFFQLFHDESEAFSYSNSFIQEVIYDDDTDRFEMEMKPKISTLFEFTTHLLSLPKGNVIDSVLSSKALSDFIYLSTFLKHRAFKEEQEVRLVASRNVHDAKFVAAQKTSGEIPKPEKPAHFRTKNGLPVRYVKIFESLGKKLPITRVLIGPGHGKLHLARAAEKLFADQEVQVSISDIPLR